MSRFQAQTTSVLDQELEDLRERLGLRSNQRADLLRELTTLAAWVIHQAERGHRIEARKGQAVEFLVHPVIERLRRHRKGVTPETLELSDSEVVRLAEALNRGLILTPALRRSLRRLADIDRRPPQLEWKNV